MMVRTAQDKENPTLTANYTVAYTQVCGHFYSFNMTFVIGNWKIVGHV
jgi:hypothetical protein